MLFPQESSVGHVYYLGWPDPFLVFFSRQFFADKYWLPMFGFQISFNLLQLFVNIVITYFLLHLLYKVYHVVVGGTPPSSNP